MKKVAALALLLSAPFVLNAAEVRRGASLEEVKSVLGAPQGQVTLSGRQLLYYERGEVELQAGAVTRVALRSVEEQAELTARRTAAVKRIREEQEIRRATQIAEGGALKARKLADPSFRTTPLAYQVAFWEDFSRRYPDVPVAEELTVVQLRFDEQMAERRAQARQAEKLADLELRVQEAEARATDAESTARRGRYYSSYYGPSYSRHPFNLLPVNYQFAETPVPVIRSPVPNQSVARGTLANMFPGKFPTMFPGSFTGRTNHEPPRVNNNCDDRNDARRNGRNDDRPRFTSRNRM